FFPVFFYGLSFFCFRLFLCWGGWVLSGVCFIFLILDFGLVLGGPFGVLCGVGFVFVFSQDFFQTGAGGQGFISGGGAR
ncbi:hypothetical protein ACQWKR_24355, partial [Salmonella enterica subsp. enterica serovar Infantis]